MAHNDDFDVIPSKEVQGMFVLNYANNLIDEQRQSNCVCVCRLSRWLCIDKLARHVLK